MRPQIPSLTSARFIAALFVVIFHYDLHHTIDRIFPKFLTDFGYQPVTFFFILSGFVLTYSHGREHGTLNISAKHFWLARVKRLFPAYILALVISIPFLISEEKITGFDAGVTLVPFMLQAWWPPAALLWNAPAWSLSNEATFYLLFPLLWIAADRLPLMRTIIVAVTLLVISSIAKLFGSVNLSAYFPLLNLPQFILGIVLAKVFFQRGKMAHSGAILLLAGITFAALLVLRLQHDWLSDPIVLCPLFAVMIYAMSGNSFLGYRILVILGNASYALYILHYSIWLWWDRVIRIAMGLKIEPHIDFALYLGLSIAISIMVDRLSTASFRSHRLKATETPGWS